MCSLYGTSRSNSMESELSLLRESYIRVECSNNFIRICINIEIKILYKYYNLIDLRRKFYGIFIYFLFGN